MEQIVTQKDKLRYATKEEVDFEQLPDLVKYDEALKNLITQLFVGDVIISPTSEAFEYATKENNKDLEFPFISLWHDATINFNKGSNSQMGYQRGFMFQNPSPVYSEDTNKVIQNDKSRSKLVENLYIKIGYQLDVWGITASSTAQVAQELMFWFYENQEVAIRYGGIPLRFTFSIGDQLVDNSDLTLYASEGKLYRYTLEIEVDAVLFRSQQYLNVLDPVIDIEIQK